MKVIATVKYVFPLIGIGLLAGAFFSYRNTSSFVSEASRAEGTVVDFAESRSRRRRTYYPIIHFINQEGKEVEFTSPVGSRSPGYSTGQKVEVLYRPTELQSATINDFFSLWGLSVTLGGLGGLSLMLGTGSILLFNRVDGLINRKVDGLINPKNESLKENGVPIETEFQSVDINTTVSINGRYPFIVLTRWQNPSTSELHIFQSNNLWFDPSDYIKSKRITVFIESNNPKKYYVDLSFLPKLAE
jgi:Protein of unknown function (DUF3592)